MTPSAPIAPGTALLREVAEEIVSRWPLAAARLQDLAPARPRLVDARTCARFHLSAGMIAALPAALRARVEGGGT